MPARTVLVTGAARGLGRATALHLAENGIRVLAGVRRLGDAEELRRRTSGRIEAVRLDVTSDESIRDAAGAVERAVGLDGLDGLVNNPGVGGSCPVEHATRAHLEQQFQVNLFGVALTTAALLPMLRRARGRIVNIGAANARLAIPLMGALSASKYALEGLTDSLRAELRRSGVRVCLVEPGMTYASEDKERFAKALDADHERALQLIPPQNRDYYRSPLERARSFQRSRLERAAPPERVTRCVLHALTAPRPRARYWCGFDGRLAQLIGSFAPAAIRDAIWRRTLGI